MASEARLLVDPVRDRPLDLGRVFGTGRAIEFEIGSGKGEFLVESARRHPEVGFLGVEVSGKFVEKIVKRIEHEGVSNARIVWMDSRFLLAEGLPDRSVRAVHLYFPDPWPKRRHHRRRHFSGDFARNVCRVLRPGGALHYLTDDAELYRVGVAAIAKCRALCPQPFGVASGPRPETGYERKWLDEGRTIYGAKWGRYGRGQ